MYTFYFYGRAAKQAVLYPVIHAAGIMGKTIVLSDETFLYSVCPDYEPVSACGSRVDVYVGPQFKTAGETETGDDDSYLYRFFVTADPDDALLVKADTVIEVINNTAVFREQRPYFREEEKDVKTKRYIVCSREERGINDDTAKQIGTLIIMNPDRYAYIYRCEEYKRFLPLKDERLAKLLAERLAPSFDVRQDNLKRIIMRDDELTTKRKGGLFAL